MPTKKAAKRRSHASASPNDAKRAKLADAPSLGTTSPKQRSGKAAANAKAKLGELRSLAAASHKNRRHGGDEEAESEKESLMEKAGIKFTQAKVGDCLFAAPSPAWPSLVSIAMSCCAQPTGPGDD